MSNLQEASKLRWSPGTYDDAEDATQCGGDRDEQRAAVSESTGTEVLVGTVPLNLFVHANVREGASNETARTVLMRTLGAVGRPLSWQLFCQPGTHMCAFNVHIVNGSGDSV